MGNGIVRISVVAAPGGCQVTARKRSRRGTLYISESVFVDGKGKTKQEMTAAIAAIAVKMNDETE